MKRLAVFLFDISQVMAQPWLEAGIDCLCVDIQHPSAFGMAEYSDWEGMIYTISADLSKPFSLPAQLQNHEVQFVAAFPPCDDLAVSGSRWFKGKGLRALSQTIACFATASEFCETSGAPYLIENPVSTISTYWREPDYRFHPWEYTQFELTDNYTKLTCLWTGNGFQMSMPSKAEGLPEPDDRIHKCGPGKERKNIRSKTPAGFARAVFEANRPMENAA